MTANPLLTLDVPGLDVILGGGLTPAALVFIVGSPGAGKTILANQILFHAARGGAKGLLLSTYSEGHEKLIQHLRPLAFFDSELIGGPITLLSLQSIVGADPDAAAASLIEAIKQTGARVVVIDGFRGAHSLFPDASAIRRLFATLSTRVIYLDVTVLITLEGSARDTAMAPELTTADVVLGLEYTVDGLRHTRYLEVVKQRGQAQLAGLHPYTITSRGITVYPRVEERPSPPVRARPTGRAPFGLPELDTLLGGGLTAGSTTILAGAPGAGKTTLALHWALAEAQSDQATVFLGFAERAEQLQQKAAFVSLDVQQAVASGALTVIRETPVQINPDIVATRLLDALAPTIRRVVIDDIAGLIQALGTRAGDYLAALAEHLYAAGVSSLFLMEIEPLAGLRVDFARSPISIVAENVLIVQQERAAGALHRVLAVLKMRYSDYDQTLRELVFDGDGIHVLTPAETAAGVLQAAADAGGGIAPTKHTGAGD